MADYNIYIHAIGTGSATNENPTVPWSQKEGGGAFSQTSSQSASGGFNFGGLTRTIAYAQNPDSIISNSFAKYGKAMAIVGAAFACVKMTQALQDHIIGFAEADNGSQVARIRMEDARQSLNNVLRPVHAIIQHNRMEKQWQRENYKLQQQRDLLGDSVINSYTNRGV